jgi:hypothetical protein
MIVLRLIRIVLLFALLGREPVDFTWSAKSSPTGK